MDGIVGIARGSIQQCINNAKIKNNINAQNGHATGGIVGYIVSGTVLRCGNHGEITGGSIIGGVAGGILLGNIKECYNRAKITASSSIGTGNIAGGIIGNLARKTSGEIRITDTYNTGAVEGVQIVGGICGHVEVGTTSMSYVERCYSSGSVTGTDLVGSFYGDSKYVNSNYCYSAFPLRGSGNEENTVWGTNCESNVANKIKALTVNLGDKFKKNTSPTINYGYPILKWEK